MFKKLQETRRAYLAFLRRLMKDPTNLENIEGKKWLQLCTPEERKAHASKLLREIPVDFAEFGPPQRVLAGELKMYNDDGSQRWDVNIWAVPDKDGGIIFEVWEKKAGLFTNPLATSEIFGRAIDRFNKVEAHLIKSL